MWIARTADPDHRRDVPYHRACMLSGKTEGAWLRWLLLLCITFLPLLSPVLFPSIPVGLGMTAQPHTAELPQRYSTWVAGLGSDTHMSMLMFAAGLY